MNRPDLSSQGFTQTGGGGNIAPQHWAHVSPPQITPHTHTLHDNNKKRGDLQQLTHFTFVCLVALKIV